ncbi:MAG: PHP domain-containing protein [Anaerolineae bacterium]
MAETWRVDLHNHTKWSKDCLVEFDTIMRLCEKRGIDRIAITDHNTAEAALQMKARAPEKIIVGEEIMTTQGEILAFYVKETVPEGLTPLETIHRLRDQGAVISVSHPFDRLRKGAWQEHELLAIVDKVDAVEVFNARCLFPADNAQAEAFAQQHHLPGTAGSDSHSRSEYGHGMTLMRPFDIDDPEDFLDALRTATYKRDYSTPIVHIESKVAKWSKKLGLRPRMWEGG